MRASRILTFVAFLATYPFWATPSYPQTTTGVGIGFGSSSSNATSGQGGQGGTGGNSNSNLTINNQPSPSNQSLTTDGRLRTDGTLDQTLTTTGRQRISGTQRVISAPSTFAPGLSAAGIEVCLGSVSAGVSFPGGGASFGTTTKDTGCDARLDARTLWSMNLRKAAVLRLCQKPEIAAAMPEVCPQPVQPGYVGAAPAPLLASAPGGAPAFEPSPVVGRGQSVMVIEKATGRERVCADFDGRRCLRWSK